MVSIGRCLNIKRKIKKENNLEFTFLLPCLNEEKTVGLVINEIKDLIKREKLNAEILVVDNGSVDNSFKISLDSGARVVVCNEVGYGNAIRYGIKESKGKFIIMGDSDTTYDFSGCYSFIKYLRDGYLFVIGNRYADLEKGSLSISHYLGVKFLSLLGRIKYKTFIYDFHCGIRGMNSEFVKNIDFSCSGMEFATEMIDKICSRTDKVVEVPVKLRKCKVERKPHLRTFRDGLRHLMYIIFK